MSSRLHLIAKQKWEAENRRFHSLALSENPIAKRSRDLRAKIREERLEAQSTRVCGHCAGPMQDGCRRKRYCSNACRQAAHRAPKRHMPQKSHS